jgi:hypothetical protein
MPVTLPGRGGLDLHSFRLAREDPSRYDPSHFPLLVINALSAAHVVEVPMVDRLILASIALILLSSAAGAKNVNSPICLPDLSNDEAFILIAEAGESAIVSKTATSIRFKPGYQVRIVKKDGRTFAVIATPGVIKKTGIVGMQLLEIGQRGASAFRRSAATSSPVPQ